MRQKRLLALVLVLVLLATVPGKTAAALVPAPVNPTVDCSAGIRPREPRQSLERRRKASQAFDHLGRATFREPQGEVAPRYPVVTLA